MNVSKTARFFAAILILSFTSIGYGQTGGDFTVKQSVIAGGGGQQSSGGIFSLDGTIGQTLAGNELSGSIFSVTSGFWNLTPLAPTAANANVSGRIITADGNGIRNARVTMTALNGETQTAVTGAFGYFSFENIPVGETYIFRVFSKRFSFNPPTQVRTVFEDIADLNFTADAPIQ